MARPAAAEEALAAPARPTLEPHGLFQLQYRGVFQSGESLPTESGVLLRRARLAVDGSAYTPALRFRAEVELGQGTVEPLDLFAAYRWGRWEVRAGQFRVPYSRNWSISDGRLAFPERSIATDEFRYDYDVGGLVAVALGRAELALGAFNGAGKNVLGNDNVDPMLFLRASGTIGSPWNWAEGDLELTRPPSLSFGMSATLDYVPVPAAYGFTSGLPVAPAPLLVTDTDMNGRPDGVRVLQLEWDVAFHWRGLALEGEAYYRHEYWGDIGTAQPSQSQFAPKSGFGGFYAQAMWAFLAGRLEAGARISSTQLSPLSIGGRRRPAASCLTSSGDTFPCQLPFTDGRRELSLVLLRPWFDRGIQATLFYSLLGWHTAEGQSLLPYTREQRFVAQLQLAF